MDMPWQLHFDVVFRYVDNLPAQSTSSYQTFDVRLAKDLTRSLRVALVGQDLWDSHHREFGGGTEIPRGMYGQVWWQW